MPMHPSKGQTSSPSPANPSPVTPQSRPTGPTGPAASLSGLFRTGSTPTRVQPSVITQPVRTSPLPTPTPRPTPVPVPVTDGYSPGGSPMDGRPPVGGINSRPDPREAAKHGITTTPTPTPRPTMPAGFRQYGRFGNPELDRNVPDSALSRFAGIWTAPDGNAFNSNTGRWTTRDGSPLAEGGMAGDANRAINWTPQSVYAGQAAQWMADRSRQQEAPPAPPQLSAAQLLARSINDQYRGGGGGGMR